MVAILIASDNGIGTCGLPGGVMGAQSSARMGALGRMHPLLFGAICLLSAVSGGLVAYGLYVWLRIALGLPDTSTPVIYVLIFLGIAFPPVLLRWARNEQTESPYFDQAAPVFAEVESDNLQSERKPPLSTIPAKEVKRPVSFAELELMEGKQRLDAVTLDRGAEKISPFGSKSLGTKEPALASGRFFSSTGIWIAIGLVIATSIGAGTYYWNETLRPEERLERELTEWRVASQLGTVDALETFLTKYPSGRFAEEAAKLVNQFRMRDQSDWSKAADENSIRAYTAYLTKWPNGRFYDEAERRIRRINTADETVWGRAENAGTESAYRQYLVQFPTGLHTEAAKEKIRAAELPRENADWQRSERTNTRQGYQAFLRLWPRSVFAEEASRRLSLLEGDNALWQETLSKGTREAYESYLERYPNGASASEAARRLKELASMQPLAGDAESRLKAKDEFQECVNCPRMVVLPSGEFTMGSPQSQIKDNVAFDNEGPEHKVKIAQPIAVGKYEVTFDQWDTCVADGGCRGYRPGDNGWGRGKLPVMNVSWDDAKLYVKWLSNKTGKNYRLLSEAEWEYAARAGSSTKFYFGDDSKSICKYANVADESGSSKRRGSTGFSVWMVCNDGYIHTAPVGSFAPNAFGLYDMLGNVNEWVEDVWHDNYSGAPADGSAWTAGADSQFRVARGGSYYHLEGGVRSAVRFKYGSATQGELAGFRVARAIRQ